MSFQENKKTEKNKLPLQQYFTFHAFHPKAVNLCLYLAGLLTLRLLNFLPIPILLEQWMQLLKSGRKWAAELQLRG